MEKPKLKSKKTYRRLSADELELLSAEHFDQAGNKILEIDYTHGEQFPMEISYEYDISGKLIREVIQGEADAGNQVIEYQYDQEGGLILKTTFFDGQPGETEEVVIEGLYKRIVLTDMFGDTSEISKWYEDEDKMKADEYYRMEKQENGTIVEIEEIEKESHSDLTVKKIQTPDGKLVIEEEKLADDEVLLKVFDETGKQLQEQLMKKDKENKRIENIRHDLKEGKQETEEIILNENEEIEQRQITDAEGRLLYKHLVERDDHGNVIMEVEGGLNRPMSEYRYELEYY